MEAHTPKEPPARDVSYFRLKLVDSLDVAIQPFFPIIFQPAHGDFRTVDLAARGAKHTLDVPPEDDKRAPTAKQNIEFIQAQLYRSMERCEYLQMIGTIK